MIRMTAEEKSKFRQLLRVLVWAKKTTGKSSGQIVSAILNSSNRDLLCLAGRGDSAGIGLGGFRRF
ncbi:MAG: hypothetical protein P4N41_09675 [Negativicutes bacterium]|nr:hypothetical protein [Negativicutes bacterium]